MALDAEEQALVQRALRVPRGRYDATRTSQLSGIPRSTVYDWAREDVLIPDYVNANPMTWSYRDLVLLRLGVWLRGQGMERGVVAKRIDDVRQLCDRGDLRVARVRADSRHFFLHGDETDVSGQGILPGLLSFVSEFRLVEGADTVDELHHEVVDGPNLVRPSARSRISPWVMAGDPCVRDTRVPTSTLHSLQATRGLSSERIVALYPGLEVADVEDAVGLERRLRGRSRAEAA